LLGRYIAGKREDTIPDQEKGNQDDQYLQKPEAVLSLEGYFLTLGHN
jgi:hypothetical protein